MRVGHTAQRRSATSPPSGSRDRSPRAARRGGRDVDGGAVARGRYAVAAVVGARHVHAGLVLRVQRRCRAVFQNLQQKRTHFGLGAAGAGQAEVLRVGMEAAARPSARPRESPRGGLRIGVAGPTPGTIGTAQAEPVQPHVGVTGVAFDRIDAQGDAPAGPVGADRIRCCARHRRPGAARTACPPSAAAAPPGTGLGLSAAAARRGRAGPGRARTSSTPGHAHGGERHAGERIGAHGRRPQRQAPLKLMPFEAKPRRIGPGEIDARSGNALQHQAVEGDAVELQRPAAPAVEADAVEFNALRRGPLKAMPLSCTPCSTGPLG